MEIDKKILDELTEQAKRSPRLRMNYDLRYSVEDQSQRMLNAIEPGTVLPIHRHLATNEVVVCVRGHFEEYYYDERIPAKKWHSLKSLESGTVLFEAKEGAYKPLSEDELWEQR